MSDLEDKIRETLRDPARALPAWRDPMPRVRREARRQRARLVLVAGIAAGVAAAAVLVTLVVLPGAAGRAPVTPPATRPPTPVVGARLPSSCRVMPQALIRADLGIRRFVYTHTYRNLVPIGPVNPPGFSCEFDGPGGKGLLIGAGTLSARKLAAELKTQQGVRVLHSVFGPGTSESSVGPPNRGGILIVRTAHGLVIEVDTSQPLLTLRQNEAIIQQVLARL